MISINMQTEQLTEPSFSPFCSQNISQPKLTQVKDYLFDSSAVIGRGSTSVVYKGVNLKTSEVVGIKKISKRMLDSEYLINSLVNEISIHSKCKHPNIVTLKDVIKSTNNVYLILEYCNSGTLRTYLKQKGKINEKEAKNILAQIIKGLDFLIQNNIIHRDIKPENILCHNDNGNMTFKICDFGFSKELSKKENPLFKSCIGSPQYMDLQRLSNESYTFKSEVFSIGVITYEMLFGYPPWQANSWYDLKEALANQQLYIPEGIVSKDMEEFLKTTLATYESDRASWEEVKVHSLFKNL